MNNKANTERIKANTKEDTNNKPNTGSIKANINENTNNKPIPPLTASLTENTKNMEDKELLQQAKSPIPLGKKSPDMARKNEKIMGKRELMEEEQTKLIRTLIIKELQLEEFQLQLQQEELEQHTNLGRKDDKKKFFNKVLKRLDYLSIMFNHTSLILATNFFYSINLMDTSIVIGKGISTLNFVGSNYGFPYIIGRYILDTVAYFGYKIEWAQIFNGFLSNIFAMGGSYYNNALPMTLKVKQKNYFQSTGCKLEITSQNYYYGGILQLFLSRTGIPFINYVLYVCNDSIFNIRVLQRKKKNMHLNLKLFLSISTKALFISSHTKTHPYNDTHNKNATLNEDLLGLKMRRVLYRANKTYFCPMEKAWIRTPEISVKDRFYDELNGANPPVLQEKMRYFLKELTPASPFEEFTSFNYYYPLFFLGLGFEKQFATNHLPTVKFYYCLFLIISEDLKFIKNDFWDNLINLPVGSFIISYKKISFQLTYLRSNLQFDILYQKSPGYNVDLLNNHLLFVMERDTVKLGNEEYAIVAQ